MKTLMKLFIRQGLEAGKFEISYNNDNYTIKIKDFTHCYDSSFSLEYMLEQTLIGYLKNIKENK